MGVETGKGDGDGELKGKQKPYNVGYVGALGGKNRRKNEKKTLYRGKGQ